MISVENFIGNQWQSPRSKKYLKNLNPATGHLFSQIPDSTTEDVNLAVDAAQMAFSAWSKTTPKVRSEYLNKIAGLIESRIDEFAEMESQDQGKPVHLAKTMDIKRAILNFRFFANECLKQNSEVEVDASSTNYVIRKPVGVAGLISPWNLPLYLLTWKIAPAIAAGNTVVCKPSELTSMTAWLLADVILKSELPAGVVNMVFGDGPKAGEALVKHPKVPLISFTGGTQTGKRIYRESAENFKKLSLELGGKNPNLIFADCDFEKALEVTIRSSFLNQGEICLCGSRIYVEDSIYDKFLNAFVEKTKLLKVGDPKNPENFMGALISEAHLNKVLGFVKLAKNEGAQILTGGERMPGEGFFMRPTVIAGLRQDSACIQDEIFGPVVSVNRFSDEASAIELANGVHYGLSATVWTKDIEKAKRVASQLDAGTVWINTWLHRNLHMPFGGMKQSGLGREGGQHSMEFFTEMTTVCVSKD
jgi:aminomuconate-semialdehyde/2-hydroxymuconate-6-semialdehyde dehydrogenase